MSLDRIKNIDQMEDGEVLDLALQIISESLVSALSFEDLEDKLGGSLTTDQKKRVLSACEPLIAGGACVLDGEKIVATDAMLEVIASQGVITASALLEAIKEIDRGPEEKIAKRVKILADALSQAKRGITVLDLKRSLSNEHSEEEMVRIISLLITEHNCKIEGDVCYAAMYAPSAKIDRIRQQREASIGTRLDGWLNQIPATGISRRGLRASLRSIVTPPLSDEEYETLFAGLINSQIITERGGFYYQKEHKPVTQKEKQIEVAHGLLKMERSLDELATMLSIAQSPDQGRLVGAMTAVTQAARELRDLGAPLPNSVKKALLDFDIFIRNDVDAQFLALYGGSADAQQQAVKDARREALLQSSKFIKSSLPAINYAVLNIDAVRVGAGLPHAPKAPAGASANSGAVAAGEQRVPLGGSATGGPEVAVTAVRRAELMAAGNELDDAYKQVESVLSDAKKGRSIPPARWQQAKTGLQRFVRAAAALAGLGIGLSGQAAEANEYLSQQTGRIDDPAEVERAMKDLEKHLREQVFLLKVVASTPAATTSPANTPDLLANAANSVDSGKVPAGGMQASVGVGTGANANFAFSFGISSSPAAAPQKTPERPVAIDITFANRDKVKMVDAFSNDVFDGFFRKFDEARNAGAEEFDAANPRHYERYEKALEAYALWREAIGVFTKQAALIIEQDFGIKPMPEDMVVFEDDLMRLVIRDTQRVRGMIEDIQEYNSLEEDEARKEDVLHDLRGPTNLDGDTLRAEVGKLDELRQKKKAEVDAYVNALNLISKQRNVAARADEIQKRSFIGAFSDRIKALTSGSFKERLVGFVKGKEKAALENELRLKAGGMSINEAASVYPSMKKREREFFEKQVETAIGEYEKIEKRYIQVKETISSFDAASREKQLIANQFTQLRAKIFADTEAFKTVARLTAGRSRDVIKGMLDPAMTSEDKLPEATGKAEKQLANLRRAADFRFGRDRYSSIPEITGSLTDEGEIVAEADSAITETIRGQLEKSISQLKTIDNANTALMRKTLLAYGERGYDIGEQVLSAAITKAKAARDVRRANIFQALLFELRSIPRK